MRRLSLIALALLMLPAGVGMRQYWTTYRDEGAPADYLEIEEPPEFDTEVVELRQGDIPVLGYHYLRGKPTPAYLVRVLGAVLFNLPTLAGREYWTLTADIFEQHMAYLAQEGYTTLTIEEAAACLRGEMQTPDKPICISFDDGDKSVLEYGLPILQRHDMKATLFVITSKTGVRWHDVDTMTWEELALLRDSGRFELSSHTHSMHYKVKGPRGAMVPVFASRMPHNGELDPEQVALVRHDLTMSRRLLRLKLGVPGDYLAWPYGFANDRLDSLAASVGFRGSVSLAAGANRVGEDDTWHMRRITISARTTLSTLKEYLDAVEMDPVDGTAEVAGTEGAAEVAGAAGTAEVAGTETASFPERS